MFTDADVKAHKRVVVLGPTVVSNLFGGADPVGQTVRVNGTGFQVVGVTAAKGSNGTQDQDDVVLAPLTAVQDTLTGYGRADARSRSRRRRPTRSTPRRPRSRRSSTSARTSPTPPTRAFRSSTRARCARRRTPSTDVFTTLLGAVAAISLLVGGIGVMNIMLVSVTERTREIGIRKAIGARRSDILAQFLTEAVLVSMLGGLTGVRRRGSSAASSRSPASQPAIALYSVFLAFGASVLAGLFFGTYPGRPRRAHAPDRRPEVRMRST